MKMKIILNLPSTLLQILIFLIVLSIIFKNTKQIEVSIISKTINVWSKNIFQITVNGNLITDYTLVLILPNQIYVNSSILSCELTPDNALYVVSPKTCVYSNTNNVQMVSIKIATNLDLINSILAITISKGIKNPPSLYVENGEFRVYDKNNNLIPSFTETIQFTYDPDILNCIMTSSSDIAGEVANYTFSFNPTNPILAGGSILITFPYFNQDSGAVKTNMISLINSNPPTLTNISGLDKNSSITIDSSFIKTFIKIINITPDNPLNTNTNIVFTITGILNPPSTDPFSGFVIDTQDNRGSIIDEASLQLQMKTPMKLTFLIVQFMNNIVNSDSEIKFTFNHDKFLPNNVKIKLTFPTDFPLSYSPNFNYVTGLIKMASSIGISKNGNTLILNNPINAYYASNNFHTFSLSQIRNPPSTKPTGIFSFEILTALGNTMYVYDGSLSYTASPGLFQNVQITMSNSTINNVSQYIFSFTPQNRLLNNSYLKITFPQEISINSYGYFDCSLVSSSSENIAAKCQFSLENSKTILYINNAFTNGYSGNIALTTKINSLINYKCALNSSSFQFESFTQDNFLIDIISQNISVKFTEGSLNAIEISPSSVVSSEVNTYKVSFTIYSDLNEKNSTIEITFPIDIIINNNTDSINYPCQLKINNNSIISFNCELKSNIIIISQLSTQNFTPASGSIFDIYIPNVKNKRNLKQSGYFYINTFLNSNCKLDKNYNNLTVTNSISPNIKAISIVPQSNFNGDITSYDITITPGSKIITNDQLKFSIPAELISSSGDSSLLILGNSIIKTQIINKVNNYYTLKIENQVLDTISFKILAMKNYYSLKPLGNFDFMLIDDTNELLESYNNPVNPIVFNQVANKLLNAKIESPNSNTIVISFNTSNIIPINGILKIKIFPNLESSEALLCEDLSLNNQSGLIINYSISDSIITITNKFSQKSAAENEQIKLSFKNIKFSSPPSVENGNNNTNPKITIDIESLETVVTINSNNNKITNYYSIDKVIGLQFSLGCNTYCEICLSNANICNQCISNQFILRDGICLANCPDSTPFIFEDFNNVSNSSNNKVCLQTCPDGYYADTTQNKCQKCIQPCNQCYNKNSCKNCIEGFLFYAADKSCNVNCPSNTIKSSQPQANGYVCIECDSNCLTCESSDYTKCLSCPSNKILFNKRCISSNECPKGTVAYEGNCAYCEAKCEACVQEPNKCIKCASGFELDEEKFSCYKPNEQCNSGYFLDNEKKCSLCNKSISNCIECDREFSCNKCEPGFSLEVNQCVKTCSEGFYFDIISLECKQCNSNCRTCSQAANRCTSCSDYNFLFNFRCVLSCPEGYFKDNNNKLCKKCESSCKNCTDEKNQIDAIDLGFLSTNIGTNTYCIQCVNGLYLLSGVCILKCPSSYVNDDPTMRCISRRIIDKQKKYIFLEFQKIFKIDLNIQRFYFLYSSIFIMIILSFYKQYDLKLFFFGACTGFITLFDLGAHVYICYLYFNNSYTLYFAMAGAALCFRILLNNIFLFSYKIHKNKDKGHIYWISYNNLNHFFTNFFIFLEYKLIRFTYSRLLKNCRIQFFDQKYTQYSRIHKLYELFRFFDMIIVDAGIILNCSLFMYFHTKYTYIWFITGEFLVLRLLIFVLVLMDLMVNKNIDDDFYYQVKSRIDVVPKLSQQISPYKEKYNFRIGDSYRNAKDYYYKNNVECTFSNDSNINKNTECTFKRSNSQTNLFSDLIEKNKILKSFYEISMEDINNIIPRDDTYLIQTSENPHKYYSRILNKEYSTVNSRIFSTFISNQINFESIQRRNSHKINNLRYLLTLDNNNNFTAVKRNNLKQFFFNTKDQIKVLNSCPDYKPKAKKNKCLEKSNKIYNKTDVCSIFIDHDKIKKKNLNRNINFSDESINIKGSKVIQNNKCSRNTTEKNLKENYVLNQFNDYLKNNNNNIDNDEGFSEIKINCLNRNSFIFNRAKENQVKEHDQINNEISFLNYSDRSCNVLKDN